MTCNLVKAKAEKELGPGPEAAAAAKVAAAAAALACRMSGDDRFWIAAGWLPSDNLPLCLHPPVGANASESLGSFSPPPGSVFDRPHAASVGVEHFRAGTGDFSSAVVVINGGDLGGVEVGMADGDGGSTKSMSSRRNESSTESIESMDKVRFGTAPNVASVSPL